MSDVEWVELRAAFGSAHKYGCCNAWVTSRDLEGRLTVCGWPRRADGTCERGHPAPPSWQP